MIELARKLYRDESGATALEYGLIAALQENPTQLERIANGFGWSLDRDDVHMMYRSPVDM